ncbi:hypothetical protein O6H91_16G009700 [Diphasiastrum complanatum]|uniref:Uncharacterized protein n=1 Tax=Diphasiastrum complanatum TaxID=34168 RepID=A0ACC2B9T7_DIPCM|nr:hypothetical protein O6H91_16G009700 [Diphasiastrum complanatum]
MKNVAYVYLRNVAKLGIRYYLRRGNGFFKAFFEKSAARRKALSFKRYEHCSTSVHVFLWMSQVDEHGNLCSPKMIYFFGFPDQLLANFPAIGKAFGAFVSYLGMINSTTVKLRKRRVHEDPFVNLQVPNFKLSLPDDCSDPCVVAQSQPTRLIFQMQSGHVSKKRRSLGTPQKAKDFSQTSPFKDILRAISSSPESLSSPKSSSLSPPKSPSSPPKSPRSPPKTSSQTPSPHKSPRSPPKVSS